MPVMRQHGPPAPTAQPRTAAGAHRRPAGRRRAPRPRAARSRRARGRMPPARTRRRGRGRLRARRPRQQRPWVWAQRGRARRGRARRRRRRRAGARPWPSHRRSRSPAGRAPRARRPGQTRARCGLRRAGAGPAPAVCLWHVTNRSWLTAPARLRERQAGEASACGGDLSGWARTVCRVAGPAAQRCRRTPRACGGLGDAEAAQGGVAIRCCAVTQVLVPGATFPCAVQRGASMLWHRGAGRRRVRPSVWVSIRVAWRAPGGQVRAQHCSKRVAAVHDVADAVRAAELRACGTRVSCWSSSGRWCSVIRLERSPLRVCRAMTRMSSVSACALATNCMLAPRP